jgi:hypothetical protein
MTVQYGRSNSCHNIMLDKKVIGITNEEYGKLTKVSMAALGSPKEGKTINGFFPPITDSAPFFSAMVPEALDPLIKVSMEDDACWLKSISLWHLEHMYAVAALPKNPQLLIQRMGPSGVWHPVSSFLSIVLCALETRGETAYEKTLEKLLKE